MTVDSKRWQAFSVIVQTPRHHAGNRVQTHVVHIQHLVQKIRRVRTQGQHDMRGGFGAVGVRAAHVGNADVVFHAQMPFARGLTVHGFHFCACEHHNVVVLQKRLHQGFRFDPAALGLPQGLCGGGRQACLGLLFFGGQLHVAVPHIARSWFLPRFFVSATGGQATL